MKKILSIVAFVLSCMSASTVVADTVAKQWELDDDNRPQKWYLTWDTESGPPVCVITNWDTSASLGGEWNWWSLTYDSELGGYTVRDAYTLEYLEVDGASSQNGAAVLRTTQQGEDVQRWDIIPEDGQSYVFIRNRTTGKYLEPVSW